MIIIRQEKMISYGGGYHRTVAPFRFLQDNVGYYSIVMLIKMAHRLIKDYEVEGLTDGPYDGHTLLLTYRHLPYLEICPGVYSELLEPPSHPLLGHIIGEGIFQHYILHRGQLGEEGELLREIGDVTASDILPFLWTESAYVKCAIEKNTPVIIITSTEDIGTQG